MIEIGRLDFSKHPIDASIVFFHCSYYIVWLWKLRLRLVMVGEISEDLLEVNHQPKKHLLDDEVENQAFQLLN